MHLANLDQWLDWQTRLHDKVIDLGLDRVRAVADRLGITAIAGKVITVAGTNGKGSTVAAYENWLQRAGFTVASYTSPHLLAYNERIRYNCQPASDEELCEAFAAVETARADISLTYFEYGTLAALHFMQQRQPDFAILEVGLGGRLDAVNIIDADLVHLTPISLDHQAWLGDDRESIGREKAGVLRKGIPVVLNDPEPPASVLERISELECNCLQVGRDYHLELQGEGGFSWCDAHRQLQLDNPLGGDHQAQNLAGVVAGLGCLLPLGEYSEAQIVAGFRGMQLAGRLQTIASHLPCRLLVDVGHNPDAARVQASRLEQCRQEGGRVVVLLGMLQDKQPELFVEALRPVVDDWWLLTLETDRGLDAAQLEARIGSQITPQRSFEQIDQALDHALSSLGNLDIMLVTGSFVTVEFLLRALPEPGHFT